MNIVKFFAVTLLVGTQFLMACSASKLEARLEANPQCKDVYNAKSGALMPCPGSDKSFYVATGLEAPVQAKPAPVLGNTGGSSSETTPAAIGKTRASKASIQTPPATQLDCKPTIHKKTGGALPCPSQD
jgi:hypothetical protein